MTCKVFQDMTSFITRYRILLGISFLLCMSLILITCYEPYWQTNDDVIFSMLINGYGLADAPASRILNCNFIWAWLVRYTPDFFDIQNYTWLIYFFTLCSILVIYFCMEIKSSDRLPNFLLCLCMLFYAFLMPQYTVTASYLAIAGILLFCVGIDSSKPVYIIFPFIILFFSFIIREVSFALIFVTGIFLYPYRKLMKERKKLSYVIIFGLFLVAIYSVDSFRKSGGEWDYINLWQKTRQSLADNNDAIIYRNYPDILSENGMSWNDMTLLFNHFSLDSDLRDSERISRIKSEIPADDWRQRKLMQAEQTLQYFLSWPIILLAVSAILLSMQRFDLRVFATLALFTLIFACIGYFNRGGEHLHRIYYPAIFFLLLLLLKSSITTFLKNYIYIGKDLTYFAVLCMFALTVLAFSRENLVEQWRWRTYDLPGSAKYLNGNLWFGWPFMLEKIYIPFRKISDYKGLRFQSAGWSALLPNSVSFFDPRSPDGFRNYLSNGFNIACSEDHLKMLSVYCEEHMNGRLETSEITQKPFLPVYHLQCVK